MSVGVSRLVPVLLLLVVFAAHAAVVVVSGPPVLEKDAAHYDDLARNLARGNGFAFSAEMQYPWQRDAAGSPQPTARRPVLFPLLVSGVYRAGLGPGGAVWMNVLLAPLTAAGLYLLARRLGLGERGGAIAVGCYLVFPRFYEYTPALLTEPLCIALLVWGAALLAGTLGRPGWRAPLGAGALLGLATLTRPTTLFLPLALLPFMARGPARGLRTWGFLLLGFLAVLAPWVARNAATFGRFEPTFTSRGYNLFMGTYPPTRGASNMPEEEQPPDLVTSLRGRDEFEINRLYTEAALANLREHPGAVAKLVAAKAVLCWFQTRPDRNMFLPTPRSFALAAPFLVLGAAGFVILSRRGAPHAWLAPALIGYLVAMLLASVATVRYNLPSMPFLFLGAAAALDALLSRIGGRRAAPAGAAR